MWKERNYKTIKQGFYYCGVWGGLVKDVKGPKAYEKIEIITERVILFEIVTSHAKMIENITRHVY